MQLVHFVMPCGFSAIEALVVILCIATAITVIVADVADILDRVAFQAWTCFFWEITSWKELLCLYVRICLSVLMFA